MADQMNSYELSRAFTDWCFVNPEKVKPIHYAIYYFAIEHCNRLGWKKNFGFPSQMVMEAIGVKNWRTYSNGLNDLVGFGFIKMIETSKNQYSANIIAIVKNTKASTKALDKALSKHSQKHNQSTVSINKQVTRNKEPLNKEQLFTPSKTMSDQPVLLIDQFPFDDFWNLYDKKVGKENAIKKWSKLKDSEKEKILQHIPKYKIAQPEKQFRKNPETYLNQKSWNDEIITPQTNGTKFETAEERKQRASREQQERLDRKLLKQMYPHATDADIESLRIQFINDPSYKQSLGKG